MHVRHLSVYPIPIGIPDICLCSQPSTCPGICILHSVCPSGLQFRSFITFPPCLKQNTSRRFQPDRPSPSAPLAWLLSMQLAKARAGFYTHCCSVFCFLPPLLGTRPPPSCRCAFSQPWESRSSPPPSDLERGDPGTWTLSATFVFHNNPKKQNPDFVLAKGDSHLATQPGWRKTSPVFQPCSFSKLPRRV